MGRQIFQPNEAVADAFRRVAQNARPKLTQYLLSRVGLTSHDIRVSCDSEPWLMSSASAMESFFWLKQFRRRISSARLTILNASSTEPALISVHAFLEIPSDSSIRIVNEDPDDLMSQGRLSLSESLQESFIAPREDQGSEFSVPVLRKGIVRVLEPHTFDWWLLFPVDALVWRSLSNVEGYRPPQPLVDHCNSAYRDVLSRCSFWIAVVLDNEELIPFRWDQSLERFVPGFWTDTTAVPSP